MGSGFIISDDGYIMTNNHVIAGATKILISLWNEDKGEMDTELKAKVVGTDPKTDLAVLKVDAGKKLPSVAFADSSKVEVGDWAIAIGSPFSLTHTVTVGIVSAKGRPSRVIGADYAELIQTDAAINPGNSGGPLCTLEGKVMGVNTAIFTRSGGYMGIGFAIPSDIAKDISDKLIKEGKIVRGWLGVYIQPMDEELGKELGIKAGVSVHAVMEDSPAAKAGIEAGDVLTEVAGKAVEDVVELQKVIASFKPGQNVKMKLMSFNSKKSRTITVKIGELPDSDEQSPAGGKDEDDDTPDQIGLVVGKAKNASGVQVRWIEAGSVAQRVGLEVGDIVFRVDRKDVNSVSGYKKAMKAAKGKVSLAVKRKGRKLFFRITLPK